MSAVPRPVFRHVAALERNVETGRSGTGQLLPPRYEPHATGVPCSFWVGTDVRGRILSGLQEGPVNAELVAPRMLIPTTADVVVTDRVVDVSTPAGDPVEVRPMRVVDVLWRQSHREITLELIGAVEPVGAS